MPTSTRRTWPSSPLLSVVTRRQRPHEMHHVPPFLLIQHLAERGHRLAAVGDLAEELRIGHRDGLFRRQITRRRVEVAGGLAVALPARAVTRGAVLLVQRRSALDRLRRGPDDITVFV